MQTTRPFNRPCLLLAVTLFAAAASAHPVSQIAVTADVHTNAIGVTVEVKAEDLVWFHNPAATNQPTVPLAMLTAAARKHTTVLLHGLHFYDQTGARMKGHAGAIATHEIGDADLPATELQFATLRYQFNYPLDRPPSHLTFRQTVGGTNTPVPCVVDFTLRRAGRFHHKPVNLSAGTPHSAELAWHVPAPESLAEIRQLQAERSRRRLGIPDLNGVHSFLHLGTNGVRHELVLPYATLASWLPPGESGHTNWETSLVGFLITNCPVTMDDRQIIPTITAFQQHGLDTIDFGDQPPTQPANVHQTRIAVVVEYRPPSPNQAIRVTWNAFSKPTPFIKSVVFTADRPPRHTYFTAQRPHFDWSAPANPLKHPPLKLLLLELSYRLHVPPNHTLLARLQPASGQRVASARIEKLTDTSATWTLQTVIEHWGHRHETSTRYTADLTLRKRRLEDLRIREHQLINESVHPVEIAPQTFIRSR